MRGRGVRVLHIFGDLLCSKWNRNAPLSEGFTLRRIFPLHSVGADSSLPTDISLIDLASDGEASADVEGAAASGATGLDEAAPCAPDETAAGGTAAGPPLPPPPPEASAGDAPASEDPTVAANDAEEALGGDAEEGEEDHLAGFGTDSSQPQQRVDEVLEALLLRALYYVVKDKHLPVLVSSLWLTLLRCAVML
jgi:hypothetical protein